MYNVSECSENAGWHIKVINGCLTLVFLPLMSPPHRAFRFQEFSLISQSFWSQSSYFISIKGSGKSIRSLNQKLSILLYKLWFSQNFPFYLYKLTFFVSRQFSILGDDNFILPSQFRHKKGIYEIQGAKIRENFGKSKHPTTPPGPPPPAYVLRHICDTCTTARLGPNFCQFWRLAMGKFKRCVYIN